MKNLFVKFHFIIGLLLAFNLSVQAADDDNLITEQITIKLEKAGSLPDRISDSKKERITNLKIIGEINDADVRLIRYMAGNSCYKEQTNGKLAFLDLSEAKIVESEGYVYIGYCESNRTSDNKIGDYFFYGCKALQNVILPLGVTKIGSNAFDGCSSLASVVIQSGVTSIGSYAFNECSSLTSIAIPSEVTSIEEGAFYKCSCIKSVVIPSGVTSIEKYTFYNCRGLTSVIIPSEVTSIEEGAFYGCRNLASVVLPLEVTWIGGYAFYYGL